MQTLQQQSVMADEKSIASVTVHVSSGKAAHLWQ
jgi:hypothetical protein